MMNLYRVVNLSVVVILFGGILHSQVVDKEKVIAGTERAFVKAAKTNPMPAPGC